MTFRYRGTSNSTHRNVVVTIKSGFFATFNMKTLSGFSRLNAAIMGESKTRTREYERKINKFLELCFIKWKTSPL